MLSDQLKQLNFTENQTKIYLALFEFTEARAGELIKKTGLHRHIVYTVLDELIARKLVAKVIKNKVQYYQVLDPTPLLLEIQEKQEIAAKAVQALKQKEKQTQQEIIIYEGIEDVRRFEIDHLKRLPEKSTNYIAGVIGERWDEVMGEAGAKKFNKTIVERKIYQKWIGYFPDQREAEKAKEFPEYIEYKYIPGPALQRSNIEFGDDFVALKNFNDTPSVVEIRNKELAKAYRRWFDILWNQEVQIYHGREGIKNHRNRSLKELKKGEEVLVLGASLASTHKLADYWRNYHQQRTKKGIKCKMLWEPQAQQYAQEREELPQTQIKYLTEQMSDPTFIDIWKNHVGIGIMRKKDPFVISIDDKDVANSFKHYFDTLWQQQNFVITGYQNIFNYIKNIYQEMTSSQEHLCITERLSLLDQKKDRQLWADLGKVRFQKKIKIKFLYHPEDKAAFIKTMKETGDKELKYCHLKPSPLITAPMSIEIFPDKVAIIQWQKGEPTLFALEGKEIAQNYKKYFEGLWKMG